MAVILLWWKTRMLYLSWFDCGTSKRGWSLKAGYLIVWILDICVQIWAPVNPTKRMDFKGAIVSPHSPYYYEQLYLWCIYWWVWHHMKIYPSTVWNDLLFSDISFSLWSLSMISSLNYPIIERLCYLMLSLQAFEGNFCLK